MSDCPLVLRALFYFSFLKFTLKVRNMQGIVVQRTVFPKNSCQYTRRMLMKMIKEHLHNFKRWPLKETSKKPSLKIWGKQILLFSVFRDPDLLSHTAKFICVNITSTVSYA